MNILNENSRIISKTPKITHKFTDSQREIGMHKTDGLPCAIYLRSYYNNYYPYHWNEEFEFTIMQRGSIIQSVNGRDYTLEEGDVMFINSSALHSFVSPDNTETVFANVLFDPALIYGSTDSIFWNKYIYPLISSSSLSCYLFTQRTIWHQKVIQLLGQLNELLRHKEWCYEFQARDILSDIIFMLCSHNSDKLINPTSQNSLDAIRIRTMISYIHENFTNQIQLKDIADSASISRRECLRCFNKILNISPMQYLIDTRIKEAKKLLSDPTRSVLDICMSCGFQDQSYFTKVFRTHTGATPVKYRKGVLLPAPTV